MGELCLNQSYSLTFQRLSFVFHGTKKDCLVLDVTQGVADAACIECRCYVDYMLRGKCLICIPCWNRFFGVDGCVMCL